MSDDNPVPGNWQTGTADTTIYGYWLTPQVKLRDAEQDVARLKAELEAARVRRAECRRVVRERDE